MRIARGTFAACVTVVTVVTAVPLGARAQTDTPARPPQDIARAEARFHEGERLFDAKQIAEACAAFDESERLDPQLGTLLNLAFCEETLGKPASAWRAYSAGSVWGEQRGQHDRAAWAVARAFDVAKRLPLVLLVLPAEASERSYAIQIDGDVVPASAWFTPVPLDPGPHTLAVSAPGRGSQQIALNVAEGPGTQSVKVPSLAPLVARPAMTEAPQVTPSHGDGRRVVAWVGLGLGVAALGLGTTYGILSLSKKSDASGHCAGSQCDAAGVADQDEANREAIVSSIAFGAGLVSLGVGVWLMLTSESSSPALPPSSPASPAPVRATLRPLWGPRLAGFGMVGEW
jgi:hypothetical protein